MNDFPVMANDFTCYEIHVKESITGVHWKLLLEKLCPVQQMSVTKTAAVNRLCTSNALHLLNKNVQYPAHVVN